tara:strand:- start:196 stop:417 length:222 start_codon:yes stop_codon:yes gene_type:complete
MEGLAKNYVTGISVFGYYEENMRLYFTCLNQDASTPQHQFELDFDTDLGKGYEIIRTPNNSRVFVTIEKPTNK